MNSLIAGLGILILLMVVTGSARNVLLVLANMPFAMVGGVLAVFATGGMLTLGSMVGFVTLFGITLRNSIMMISHYEHLVGVALEAAAVELDGALGVAGVQVAPVPGPGGVHQLRAPEGARLPQPERSADRVRAHRHAPGVAEVERPGVDPPVCCA